MNAKRLQLLIVDDENDHIEAIRRAFEDAGGEVDIHAVGTLRAYRERAAAQPPDIAVVDLNLPDGRAVEVLSHPPEDAPFPALVMTAFGTQQIVVEVMKAGAMDYVVKSVEAFAAMPHTVQRVLREWKLLRQHKQAEVELAHMASFPQLNIHPVIEAERAGRICFLNPAAEALFPDLRQEEARHAWLQDWETVTLKCGQDTGDRIVREVAIGGRRYQQDIHYVRQFRRFRVYGTDITELKLGEEALRKSEMRYRSYIDLPGQIGWVTNAAGEIDEDVPSLRKFTGQRYDEAKGLGWAKAIHPDDLGNAMRVWSKSVASRAVYDVEYRMRRHDGVYRDLLVRGFPIVKDDGSVQEWVGTCVDITERKRDEEALRASEAEFRTLAEAMPQIVWITRADGWNIHFNQKWTDYTGLTPEESRGHGWNKPFHPDDQKPAWDAWQKATTEAGTYSIESRLRRADGVYRWWLVRGVPLRDAVGKILKWYGTCTDIHDMKLAEEDREDMQSRLLQAQKMEAVGVLAGGVAHDFNNILTAIKAYAGFIHRDLQPEDPMRSDAEEILTASNRAGALTRQLLAFSRKQILSPQVVDFNKIVSDMTSMLKRLLREDIELVTELTSLPCAVLVDPGQLEQVIMNLVVNARDAMPNGGRLSLETELVDGPELPQTQSGLQAGPAVRLKVRDNGSGMADEVRRRVFEPFFTTKEQGKGTGLGLSTVFGIIKQSNGQVSVESEPGKGSAFSVYLPLVKEAVAASAASEPKALAGKNSETVLLVEDDEMLRRLGERLLKQGGYTVIVASDGKSALETMERHGKPVDLLLSDVVMPGMSGRDLARELERRQLIGRTLYMSGYTDDAIVRHGVLEPGIAFIYKPFTVESLSLKLREVLDGPADQAKA